MENSTWYLVKKDFDLVYFIGLELEHPILRHSNTLVTHSPRSPQIFPEIATCPSNLRRYKQSGVILSYCYHIYIFFLGWKFLCSNTSNIFQMAAK